MELPPTTFAATTTAYYVISSMVSDEVNLPDTSDRPLKREVARRLGDRAPGALLGVMVGPPTTVGEVSDLRPTAAYLYGAMGFPRGPVETVLLLKPLTEDRYDIDGLAFDALTAQDALTQVLSPARKVFLCRIATRIAAQGDSVPPSFARFAASIFVRTRIDPGANGVAFLHQRVVLDAARWLADRRYLDFWPWYYDRPN